MAVMRHPIAAAVVALLFASNAGAAGPAPKKAAKATRKTVKCYGINECMGKGLCGMPDSAKNSCKGKGVLPIDTAEDCIKHGGQVVK